MIIIRMEGGLGNQMFQYALYLQLKALGREVSFDDNSGYENQEPGAIRRGIRLGEAFGITYPVCEKEDYYRLTDSYPGMKAKLLRLIKGRKSLEKHDEDLVFDAEFLSLEEGYFTGYFQSEKYFAQLDNLSGEVRRAFTFREGLLAERPDLLEIGKRILTENADMGPDARETAALHLRFGDYLAKEERYGGICTDAYYEAAIREIARSTGKKLSVYVFSNEEERAAQWILDRSKTIPEEIAEFVPVTGTPEEKGEQDLCLMTLCHSFILANSSFSWWAAYLGKERGGDGGAVNPMLEPDKQASVIIAPARWLNGPKKQVERQQDIYTPDMIRIDESGAFAADLTVL